MALGALEKAAASAAAKAASPQRQRLRPTGLREGDFSEVATPLPKAGTLSESSSQRLPAEIQALPRPTAFLIEPKGERLELAESGAQARRVSGLSQGVALLGPLSLEKSSAYFEVEILEIEPNRTNTMAIGLCLSLPSGRGLKAERGSTLEGSVLLGYDLPKVFVNGTEASKLKGWRPLKELAVGTKVGLLIDRGSMALTVYVNGEKKASTNVGDALRLQRWPDKVWGVLDVHGAVRSVRLAPSHPSDQAAEVEAPPAQQHAEKAPRPSPGTPARMASTQDLSVWTPQVRASGPEVAPGEVSGADTGARRAVEAATSVSKKRMRLRSHACGCLVHLLSHRGEAIHVPNTGDFVIGRNPKSCNLNLDSEKVPNMISRRHAILVSNEDAVMVIDCDSTNGTFVNGRRVGRETLRQGDVLIIGNPAQIPEEFRFEVSMPLSS